MGNVLHRGKGSFTHVENTIFFDHGLSAKAKGIYCQIRSLEGNPEWVFTIKGFASLVRDGADAVTAGIKELETAGYIIRTRKRSENGRFLKAEEATWITLDDPAMHAQVAAELKADGYAILSEFTREPPANVEAEPSPENGGESDGGPEKAQVVTRTGKPVSGKATSGEPAPINYSSGKTLEPDKEPLSCPPDEGAQSPCSREAYRRCSSPHLPACRRLRPSRRPLSPDASGQAGRLRGWTRREGTSGNWKRRFHPLWSKALSCRPGR